MSKNKQIVRQSTAETLMRIEDALYEKLTLLTFMLIPDVQDVIAWIAADFNTGLASYGNVMQSNMAALVGRRTHQQWIEIFTALGGTQKALDDAMQGDYEPLRRVLYDHMKPEMRAFLAEIETLKRKRQYEAAQQHEAEVAQAAQDATDAANKARANKIGEKADAAKRALENFRKANQPRSALWTIPELKAAYLKAADSTTEEYKYISELKVKTIQNWQV